jgi:hypothetical protein
MRHGDILEAAEIFPISDMVAKKSQWAAQNGSMSVYIHAKHA